VAPIPIVAFRQRQSETLDTLRQMVETESPTTDKTAVDALGAWIAARLEALGFAIERLGQADAGDHWLARWGDGEGGILLLHHIDTVFPVGTLERTPWRVDGDLAFGPGVLDMKGGVAVTLAALAGIVRHGVSPARPVWCLLTSDEETGSRTSRAIIEDLARRSSLVLVLEPARPDGAVKTRRKGTGVFVVEAIGRAAHAGNDPEKGVNAIEEIALQVPRIHALADPSRGTTVSVGVIEGGTRANVIPERCRLRVDVRALDEAEQRRVEAGFAALRPILPEARLEIGGGWNRPAMERTPAVAGAYERARRLGEQLGLSIVDGAAGGGSDANFVAALGLSVLDGLGPVGEGPHSEREFIRIPSLFERAALLAALLTEP